MNTAGASPAPPVKLNWEAFARAHVHPVRVSIMELFEIEEDRELSSTDLAIELQMPLGNIDYHVQQLAKRGFLVRWRSRAVRGAEEHFFRADFAQSSGERVLPPGW